MNAFRDIKIVKEMRTIFCLIFLLFCAGTASASESNGVTVKIFSASEIKDQKCYIDIGACYSKYWDISPEDMFEIGSKLYPYLKEKLPEDVDLSEYKQQYYGFYDKNGEKNIHINFFCVIINEDSGDINHLQVVFGGGDCYFNLNYDRGKKKFYGMHINDPY